MVSIRSINTSEQEILIATINQPARDALQLLLADGTPQWGWGRLFGVEKLIRRCKIHHLAEYYKQAIEEVQGPIAKKKQIFGPEPEFWAPKKNIHFLIQSMF